MSDLISRSALIECFEKLALALANAECYAAADATQHAAETLRLAPSIDAEPVRHGKWINKTEMRHGLCDYRFDCSECSHIFWASGVENFNFCPCCGAKMDLPELPQEV